MGWLAIGPIFLYHFLAMSHLARSLCIRKSWVVVDYIFIIFVNRYFWGYFDFTIFQLLPICRKLLSIFIPISSELIEYFLNVGGIDIYKFWDGLFPWDTGFLLELEILLLHFLIKFYSEGEVDKIDDVHGLFHLKFSVFILREDVCFVEGLVYFHPQFLILLLLGGIETTHQD